MGAIWNLFIFTVTMFIPLNEILYQPNVCYRLWLIFMIGECT